MVHEFVVACAQSGDIGFDVSAAEVHGNFMVQVDPAGVGASVFFMDRRGSYRGGVCGHFGLACR